MGAVLMAVLMFVTPAVASAPAPAGCSVSADGHVTAHDENGWTPEICTFEQIRPDGTVLAQTAYSTIGYVPQTAPLSKAKPEMIFHYAREYTMGSR
jgi:hypothetical protein